MNIRKSLLALFVSLLCLGAYAQSSLEEITANPEKAGGVYLAYPTEFAPQSKAPKGYKPFYISHYGRHGSRYLISNEDYTRALYLFRDAHESHALTALGEDVYKRLEQVFAEADGHGGDLSPLGVRQHRGIAERMYKNYPDVFKQKGVISARSTTSMRVALSMVAFIGRLTELNPKLNIDWETSNANMWYLNSHTDEYNQLKNDFNGWRKNHSDFGNRGIPDETRFLTLLYKDPSKGPKGLMGQIFNIAVDLQDMETDIDMFDLFTPEEMYELWKNENCWFFLCDGDSPLNKGTAIESCKTLLRHFINQADLAVQGKGDVATLRFGHDGNIIPLAAIMRLKDCDSNEPDVNKIDEKWRDYYVSPMGANIQLIFYKKKGSDDVLVKFLHNERETSIPVSTDIAPYYHWKDVRDFFIKQAGGLEEPKA